MGSVKLAAAAMALALLATCTAGAPGDAPAAPAPYTGLRATAAVAASGREGRLGAGIDASADVDAGASAAASVALGDDAAGVTADVAHTLEGITGAVLVTEYLERFRASGDAGARRMQDAPYNGPYSRNGTLPNGSFPQNGHSCAYPEGAEIKCPVGWRCCDSAQIPGAVEAMLYSICCPVPGYQTGASLTECSTGWFFAACVVPGTVPAADVETVPVPPPDVTTAAPLPAAATTAMP